MSVPSDISLLSCGSGAAPAAYTDNSSMEITRKMHTIYRFMVPSPVPVSLFHLIIKHIALFSVYIFEMFFIHFIRTQTPPRRKKKQ